MDESDSESDSASVAARDDENEVKYPVEGLFLSHAEKQEIMNMREIEREQILAERREENERIRQNRMLRQLVVNQDKDKKRKASAADLEDGQRKTSRIRTKIGGTKVGETSSGIDSLRRAREERHSRMQQRERENDRRKQHSPSYRRSPERDDDRDSDVEWAGGKGRSRTPEIREIPPAELRDIERGPAGSEPLRRGVLLSWLRGCHHRLLRPDQHRPRPRPPRAGCLPYGSNKRLRSPRSSHSTVCQLFYIPTYTASAGFNVGRPYAIPDQRGHQMVVDLYIKAAHGKAQREWPFISCSDRAFTEVAIPTHTPGSR